MDNQMIQKVRIQKGLTVVEAAKLAGMTKSRFSRIELGHTTIGEAEKKEIVETLNRATGKEPGKMFISRNTERISTDDYLAELRQLEANGADKKAIHRLKRRISYSRWYEKQKGRSQ